MKRLFTLIASLFLFQLAFAAPEWEQVAQGVWKTVIGTPEDYNLLKAAGCQPLMEGFESLPEAALPAVAAGVTYKNEDGKTYLSFPLERGEQIYGFGLNFQTVHQRGKILNLHVDHYGGKDTGRTHAPVPFYISSLGYGVLVNSARYLTVYAGSGARKDSPNAPEPRDRNTDKKWTASPYSDAVSIVVPAEGVEVYVFAGPEPLDVVCRYNLLCGGGTLPPRWGLGFTQRTQKLYDAQKAIAEADLFEQMGYPLDFLGLEPGWQSKAYPCTMEWDQGRFPDPAGFVKALAERKVRVNLWTNPYISPDSAIYGDIYPYTGSHTVWCGIVPDFQTPEAVQIWQDKLLKEHIGIGVSGYKIDEIDGYDRYLWPDVATFPSGLSAEQERQTYGLNVMRVTADLYHAQNTRTYGLVRASNAGGASLPFVLYNDYYSHKDFITALINSGFCGVLWTPEARSSKTAEEWIRRFETVVFSPMAMINAWSSGTKPWSFPEVADAVKEYSLLRMQMMPYWYTEFARYHFYGRPPFRAMNLEPGFNITATTELKNASLEDNPYLEEITHEIKDQYMAGEYLLVAPLFEGETSRKVILPMGDWFDFYTGEYVGNGQTIKVDAPLDKIPVFVKDGGIIPMYEPRLHAPADGEKVDLVIRHYGHKDACYRLYDDDGETFDYENGEYTWRDISVTRDRKGRLKGSISKAPKGAPDNVGNVSWKFMTE